MARVLIVGCGCRGRSLARSLLAGGHAVRGTTRDPERADEIAASGAEPFVGDPARVGTLTPALDGVAVVCLLLGSATGTSGELEALHDSRLEMLLLRIIDTTVRAVAYEAVGTIEQQVLDRGSRKVRDACQLSRIPYVLLAAEPASDTAWATGAAADVEALLAR
jgi:predicted dinucleotide-binding enzyme